MPDHVLIIDDDVETAAALGAAFNDAGLAAESVDDTFAAMEMLREQRYRAVILDPAIRHRLNGYAVLNFLELEQPKTLDRLFLLTGMSEQTIRRTAPAILPRLFRKPSALTEVAAAVIQACGLRAHRGGHSGPSSVLLVEDDSATAQATAHVLQELGYSVQWTRNGQEALEALGAREFDAIVLDLVMPHVDGFAVLEHLHAHDLTLLRRVIVITGMPEKYIEALDSRALRGVVRKPLDVARLKHLLLDRAGRDYS